MKITNELSLLPPELLPDGETFSKSGEVDNAIAELLSKINCDDVQLQKKLIKETLISLSNKEKFSEIDFDGNESQQNRNNDEAFNIKRVHGDIPTVLSVSVLQVYYLMLDNSYNSGCSLTAEDWNLLNHAFVVLLKLYNGLELPSMQQAICDYPSIQQKYNKEEQSYERWLRGHYIFMIIVQGLIITLNTFMGNVKNQNFENAKKFLNLATLLLSVTEVSFKFTGEFSTASYNANVRPTLMPPIAKPEMSGLYWRDHQYMMKSCFKPLKSHFAEVQEIFSTHLDNFYNMLSNVYKTHALVCNKFIGPEQSSLRSTDSAVGVLEKFRQTRLATIRNKVTS